jgi:hypothetical protein
MAVLLQVLICLAALLVAAALPLMAGVRITAREAIFHPRPQRGRGSYRTRGGARAAVPYSALTARGAAQISVRQILSRV